MWLKTIYSGGLKLDYLISEWSWTPNLESVAHFNIFPKKYE